MRVTAHDTAVGRGDGSELTVVTVAVDEGEVRPWCQTIDGQLHGLHAGGEDIRLVDLPSGDGGHGPGQGLLLYPQEKGLPLLFRQLFGVIQAGKLELLRENNGGGVNRSHQRTGTGLIHPTDKGIASVMGLLFVAQIFHIINTPLLSSCTRGRRRRRAPFR